MFMALLEAALEISLHLGQLENRGVTMQPGVQGSFHLLPYCTTVWLQKQPFFPAPPICPYQISPGYRSSCPTPVTPLLEKHRLSHLPSEALKGKLL